MHHNARVDDMFAMVTWTENEEKFLIQMLLDFQKKKMLLSGVAYDKNVLQEIASLLVKAFQKPFCYRKILKKCDSLKATYNLWHTVNYWPGVTFNVRENTFEANASTWDAIIQEHPHAKKFRDAPEPKWFELYGIFDPMRVAAEEKKFNDSCYFKETPRPEEEEDEDEGAYVRDEQSFVAPPEYLVPLPGSSKYAGKSEMEIWQAQFDEELGIEVSAMSSVGSSIWP
ncbi:unnamed protein product [Cuscuta epithymum]|uniref:Myb/SANT-like domain-containing protein n=1 Tax=Cuscuta epithymum TaxID=186058 RepID=A0AAV0EGN0_9ASTE|nr:unnamed protein product [Cuscuta epithymum]